jgi:hypothetical protein
MHYLEILLEARDGLSLDKGYRTFNKMKLALLLFLLAICGSTMFGKGTRHAAKHTRHSRKQVHHAHRRLRHRPAVSAQATAPPSFFDTRRLALLQYFQGCACPAARWADTFVQEADRQGLDWRLVASIAMIESTGGKRYKNRNILGWGSASARFRSEQVGIQYVSARLGRSPLYRGKSLLQVLRTYNSVRRNYATLVTGVMQRLATIENSLRIQQASLLPDRLPSFQPEQGLGFTELVFIN